MSKDFFEHKAGTYEKDDNRVSNVENIANSIIASVSLDRSMHLMDFDQRGQSNLKDCRPSYSDPFDYV